MIEKDKKGYVKHFLKAGLFSIICGAITGLIIFGFKFCAKKIEHFSTHIYETTSKSVVYIILVFIALIVFLLFIFHLG